MEERKNYVIYVNGGSFDDDEVERVVSITKEQVRTIRWFIENFDINGCIELAEIYEGEEI